LKIAILSINLHTKKLNYGAILHSWFFQRLMMQRSDVQCCDIIDYIPINYENKNMRLLPLSGSSLKKPKLLARNLLITIAHNIRYSRFERFIQSNIIKKEKQYSLEQLRTAELPYDVVFFESDVIWSPGYFGGDFDPAFFGAIDSMKSMRKIAYSASMANGRLSEQQKERLRELLKYPDAISMRETYASELVRALTNKPVVDVVDPVLLADPEDFDAITSKRLISQDYLLVYFPTSRNQYVLDCAHRYAKERNLRLVEVSCGPTSILKHKTYAAAGVEAFLSLIRNASVVFSTSLHGTCFALLFHKEFYAFDRMDGQKYKDLCMKFGLEKRFIEGNSFTEAPPIDWNQIDSLRAKYRSESLKWIDYQLKSLQVQT